MSKTKLLLDVVGNLRSLADSIQSICNVMSQGEPEAAPEKVETPTVEQKQQKAEKALTIEEVRPVLGRLSHAGYTEQIHQLILKYGGNRLGEVDPKHYAALLKEAEGLANAAK